ncbi:hypothetical protein BCR34DRAFT_249159 [Clohesyomyces aquaticus]|uniref:glutathione transferase n=1 Tax=Clohesyomyces aquaticus TaxID=1231657 RepID=A0A1Y1ZUK0_9PLEO|nr:hypothetical protein BCR34DRAFT_249159 [Clohesyomyces aquaticus]
MNDTSNSVARRVHEDKVVLYVVKSTPTSGANVVKVLILIESLNIPHHIEVVASTKTDPSFHKISPTRMVPALESIETQNGKKLNVFESSSCLEFLVDKYDLDGAFGGKTLWERTQIRNWLMMHTSGLGATAKLWLTLKRLPHGLDGGKSMEPAITFLTDALETQYTILDSRLSEATQSFIALPDRPTIADFATLPFANSEVAAMAGIDLIFWPNLKSWGDRMCQLPAVAVAMKRVTEFGA